MYVGMCQDLQLNKRCKITTETSEGVDNIHIQWKSKPRNFNQCESVLFFSV